MYAEDVFDSNHLYWIAKLSYNTLNVESQAKLLFVKLQDLEAALSDLKEIKS